MRDVRPVNDISKDPPVDDAGISDDEAKQLLEKCGYNELPVHAINPILKFLTYFWGPIPWMIEVAVVLSAAVGHWIDFGIILTLLVANAIVGFWEEFQAGNAISALKATLALQAKVKRNGKWSMIAAREIVPGDLIRVRLGDIVPADARLMPTDPIEVDQSALTGESLPVERKGGETIYSGSIVRQGEADALVRATGQHTFFGKTARLVETANTVSHFQRAVLKIGNYLIIVAVVLVALILSVATFRGDPLLETLEFALVLTIAAIPVAMPTVLSVTMAVGARILAQRQAIVSRLVAIEEMAGVDLLCSDKTGTLTQNRLTLGNPFVLDGVSPEQLVTNAAFASRPENQDPIDLAIINASSKTIEGEQLHVSHFQPFDPIRKRTEATITDAHNHRFKVSKGAPQVILALVEDSNVVKQRVEDAVNDFARKGFRSLGVARADGDGPWRFLGILSLYDPPREDSKSTIATAAQMGVKVKMVTGDQVAIGKEIAQMVGLGTNILDASLFEKSKRPDPKTFSDAIEDADGFAQVFPEHKYQIVDVLQQRGHIVGMTGDGVNDAPALKKADCGIAVSGATDAARAAADIVLLAPGLSVIIDAIKESRKIFQRMNSYAIYRIAETIRVLLFMTFSILVFNFYPVTAVMIVLLAILNDGAILAIAYDRVRYSNRPEAWNMRVVLGLATVLGIAGVFASFGLFYLGEHVFQLSREMIQSIMYLKLSVAGHFTVFVTRTRGPFWSIRPARILFFAVVATQLIATFIAVYGLFMPAIGWKWAIFIWCYALAWFFFNDRLKLLAYRFLDDSRSTLAAESIASTTA